MGQGARLPESPARIVLALGAEQTLAWASSYYLPAILAASMARDLGLSSAVVFAAFSWALLISALPGPYVGRAIDRWGGRSVLMLTNAGFALGLLALSYVRNAHELFAAWTLIGLAMGSGLYEAAFAALVRIYSHQARNAITGITLIAGFASTVGWPLTAWMDLNFGWRTACVLWAAAHIIVGMPLNALLPRVLVNSRESDPSAQATAAETVDGSSMRDRRRDGFRSACLLAFVFAATWFIATAMAAHLPQLLQGWGMSLAMAVGVGALVGPAQVGGRLLEFGLLRHVHPLLSARLAALAHPIGVAALCIGGPAMASLFAVLHGAGNGILTIAKGTLPLVLFGPQGYGARQGWLMMPARMAQAFAPFMFGLALAQWGTQSLWISAILGVAVFFALMMLPSGSRD